MKTSKQYPNYLISEDGKSIFSNHKNKYLKFQVLNSGYQCVGLVNKDGVSKNETVHRAVAYAYVPNPENKPQVNHKDGDKLNNHYLNLEWATNSENVRHMFDTGLGDNARIKAAERMKIIGKKFSKLNGERLVGFSKQTGKPIDQLTLEGAFITSFVSIAEAFRKTGINNINMALSGQYAQAGGYKWRLKNSQAAIEFNEQKPPY